MKFNKYAFLCLVAVAAIFVFGSTDLLAQSAPGGGKGIGDMADRGSQAGNQIINFLRVGAIVIGVIAIIGGVMAIIKDARSQGNGPVSKGQAAVIILCGALLTFVTLLIESAGETVWGSTAGGRDKIEIQQ